MPIATTTKQDPITANAIAVRHQVTIVPIQMLLDIAYTLFGRLRLRLFRLPVRFRSRGKPSFFAPAYSVLQEPS